MFNGDKICTQPIEKRKRRKAGEIDLVTKTEGGFADRAHSTDSNEGS